ncbi:beta-lactamase family protein [Arsenicicoccus piscis]|uniref:Beta-lactamase-related domain-containing protein n=1 Tax=Arsenicicoccus piscis TaxID=673954 RepID=A0ABQ6HKX7_9MICO|nr:serine hydrolase [Arsenicicoccus piscis]MCH8627058.1 beta-lactamase family protein [Arsenicicoccus piscis]GMA19006.1 hypothetical protein GCM10025862_10270 [Arsenicicoccus piscis]
MLTDFLDVVAAHPEVELHSLLLLQDGQVLAEGYADPYLPTDRALVYSVSKTFTATAVGLAVHEGRFALEDRVVDLLPADVPEPLDDRIAEVTVHHLLSMSTGRDVDTFAEMVRRPAPQWARTWLSMRPAGPVGSRHVYDNGCSWLLGEIVRRSTGESLVDYLRPRLLEPLGIEIGWETDDLGRELGLTGVHVTTAHLSRLGELYRCDGVHEGVRLLPEGWVDRLSTAHIPTTDDKADWTRGYGYQVWQSRHGYRLDGAYGQFVLVLPEQRAVLTLTSQQENSQVLLDAVWEHVLPALVPGVQDDPAELAARLEALVVPGPGRPVAADQFAAPPVTAVAVRPRDGAADGSAGTGWTLTLSSDGRDVEIDADPTGWTRTELTVDGRVVPVAAVVSGGVETGRLEVALAFPTTPHVAELSLELDADGRGSTDRCAWRTAPLERSRLVDLHMW